MATKIKGESESVATVSTGTRYVKNGDAGALYDINGKISLAADAGYAGHEPVQFADETDAQFNARVDMFESARANAGGLRSQESADRAKARLKVDYDAAIAKIDASVQK